MLEFIVIYTSIVLDHVRVRPGMGGGDGGIGSASSGVVVGGPVVFEFASGPITVWPGVDLSFMAFAGTCSGICCGDVCVVFNGT